MLNIYVVNGCFDALEIMINELGVTENEIWNCDESGLNFEHTPCRVVTGKTHLMLPLVRYGATKKRVGLLTRSANNGLTPYFLSTVVLRGPNYSYVMAIRHTKH